MFTLRPLILIIITSAFHLGMVGVSRCQQPKEDPAPALQKAAETAEVHGIWLSEPLSSRFDTSGIKNWPKLLGALRANRGPGGRVLQFANRPTHKEFHKFLADDDVIDKLDDKAPPSEVYTLKGFTVDLFNEILHRPTFYTDDAFKDTLLTKEIKDAIALGAKRTARETAMLNWNLLRAAFPDSVPELPNRFRTVRVEVVGDKDVVLVLASNTNCRWEVTLKGKAKVTGVLLCGYHPQEVVGVEAPVVYRCYYAPDGVTRTKGHAFFKGYDPKPQSIKEFQALVKTTTGQELTAFEGLERPKPTTEPFLIPSKSK